ncbi:TetR/AcrR family transcriptional regulator [Streptomyces sp. NBC_01476]|uniref:TetR/AcrR family transcriptional regulator n=1 Tax=Streptomyces sp. NBC_01476 TaxID=2903881 RepID=UPI002E37B86D|nr:TetR family transcriptional regulator [Streptomyces sp. NBC_01476]
MPTPAKGMSTRAVQAEQTRQQILGTAQRLFIERGYTATSLQMIADELGLTKAAVYYHFRAKHDILHAAMMPGILRMEALLDQAEAMRGRRARIDHVVSGFVDFLVENRHYAVMASTDPDAKHSKRPDKDGTAESLRLRGLTLFFGEHPTGAERLSYNAVFSVTDSLPDLVDLTDEELREALQTTMLRILRVPAASPAREQPRDRSGWEPVPPV